jgi:hypothetical protein
MVEDETLAAIKRRILLSIAPVMAYSEIDCTVQKKLGIFQENIFTRLGGPVISNKDKIV